MPAGGGGGCGGSGAAPPGRAFTRSPPQQVCSRRRGRSGRRKRRVRGRQGGRPPPIAPRRGPCCRGPASARRRQPRAGAGVSERRAAAAPYIAGGAAPPAPSNRCRSRAGCPPACPRRRSRRRLPWPSLPHPRAVRRGGSARSSSAHRPSAGPPRLPLQAPGGARARPPPRRGAAPPLPARRGTARADAGAARSCRCSLRILLRARYAVGLGDARLPRECSARRHVPRRYKCSSVQELGVREGQGRGRSGRAPRHRPPRAPGEPRCSGGARPTGSHRLLYTSSNPVSSGLRLYFLFFPLFFWCAWRGTPAIEQPRCPIGSSSARQAGTGAAGAHLCPGPAAPASVYSLQPQESFAHKGSASLLFAGSG